MMDLGYYSHTRLARLLGAGVHVVTRLHPQAAVQVEEEGLVQEPLPGLAPHDGAGGRIVVHHDQRVTVGSPHNHKSTVVAGLRLVTATVAPTRDAARHGAQPVVFLGYAQWSLLSANLFAHHSYGVAHGIVGSYPFLALAVFL